MASDTRIMMHGLKEAMLRNDDYAVLKSNF